MGLGPISTLGRGSARLEAMPPKKAPKALGGLTLTRAIGPQDIKLLNKLTSDPVGVGIFSSIGLTSCQLRSSGASISTRGKTL